jgi:CheY-like chemotaxis protein
VNSENTPLTDGLATPAPAIPDSPREDTPAIPPLIVAVDDEIDDVFFLKNIIKRAGISHRFQHFANGDAAVSFLSGLLVTPTAATFPLVCLLDIKMTGMSGLEVLQWIRAQRPLDELPVIMFSGSDDPRDLQKAKDLGAQCYVKKFPSPEVMSQLLQEAESFAAREHPRQLFLQWHYRFIDSSGLKVPTLV